jgi:hypothetical protein
MKIVNILWCGAKFFQDHPSLRKVRFAKEARNWRAELCTGDARSMESPGRAGSAPTPVSCANRDVCSASVRTVLFLAENPEAGDVMKETGGCRKVRIAKDGEGKSGGYRVITWFGGGDIPVFLLSVFTKRQKANLSNKERNALAKLTGTLKASLGGDVTKLRKRS